MASARLDELDGLDELDELDELDWLDETEGIRIRADAECGCLPTPYTLHREQSEYHGQLLVSR